MSGSLSYKSRFFNAIFSATKKQNKTIAARQERNRKQEIGRMMIKWNMTVDLIQSSCMEKHLKVFQTGRSFHQSRRLQHFVMTVWRNWKEFFYTRVWAMHILVSAIRPLQHSGTGGRGRRCLLQQRNVRDHSRPPVDL